jgi:1-acyl-sn-glycerol-3-phosphate acyltransferase
VHPYLKIAYQPYKWLFVIPMVFILTMILGLVCILVGLIFKGDAANMIAVAWSRLCCGIAPIKVNIIGRGNYKRSRSYVVVANHQSMADIPVVHGFLGLNIKWIMKKELKKVPIFGAACHRLGCIFVDRTNSKAAIESIENGRQQLSKKASVLFFAEGTRSRDGKVMPFKKGAFRFAWETGLPILPITIKNSLTVLPSDTLDLIPGQVDIIVHPPIRIMDARWEYIEKTMEYTRKVIADAL